ncbi:TolC family outer membrane protein [Paenalcaligenes hominis]|uniref:TolC family outer membrane protein n=1 Tax=Paenalcaligenes hominis TaxID=643674 RepID=UPI0035248334
MMRLLSSVVLCFATAATAAASSLDLWQAWQSAQHSDPLYAAQQAQTLASQEQIAQARAQLLPEIDAVTSLQRNDTRRASRLNQAQQSNANQWQLRLTQPLLDLSAIAHFERSKFLAASALFALDNAKNDLLLRLSTAYFDVLAAQDSLHSLQAEHDAITQQMQSAKLAFELGGATITDTYEAQSRLDLINAQLIQTRQQLESRRQHLARITGLPIYELAPLRNPITLPQPEPRQADAWVYQAQNHNLELAQRRLAVQAQQYQLKASQREHAPTLSLQARSGSQNTMGIYGPNTSPRALDSSIGIELSIPLYKGGAINSKVRENASVLQQRLSEQENARRAATEAAQVHFVGVESGLLQVQTLEAAERSSLQSVQANQTAYEIGVRTTIDVLNAQQQLYETQRALAQARYNTLLHGLNLKNAAGLLQENDLLQLNQLLEHPSGS